MKNENISEKLNGVFYEIAQIAQEDAQKPRQSTGFLAIDKLTTGLVDEDLVVIASRPAMGKTVLALNIANHLTKKKVKTIAIFSLEMSKEQIVHRLQRASGHEYTKADINTFTPVQHPANDMTSDMLKAQKVLLWVTWKAFS